MFVSPAPVFQNNRPLFIPLNFSGNLLHHIRRKRKLFIAAFPEIYLFCQLCLCFLQKTFILLHLPLCPISFCLTQNPVPLSNDHIFFLAVFFLRQSLFFPVLPAPYTFSKAVHGTQTNNPDFYLPEVLFSKGKLIKRYVFQLILHFLNAGFYLSPRCVHFSSSPRFSRLSVSCSLSFFSCSCLSFTHFSSAFSPQFSR